MSTIRTGLPVSTAGLNKSAPFSEPELKMPGCALINLSHRNPRCCQARHSTAETLAPVLHAGMACGAVWKVESHCKTEYGLTQQSSCRYTGYIQGLMETYAQTPIPAQLQTKQPPPTSFLFTRSAVPPVSTPSRDPCNFPSTYKPSHELVNLWPSLQSKGKQKLSCCRQTQAAAKAHHDANCVYTLGYTADNCAQRLLDTTAQMLLHRHCEISLNSV